MIETLYQKFLTYPVICTDTRNIVTDSIFFALKGANFNGNEFAKKALQNGAKFAVIDEEEYAINDQCILVEDVLKTLQKLAKYHRSQLKIPVIGITGSNGKTTTKELIYSVLSRKFNVFATQGNFNNHIGVPLSVLSVNNRHEIAIIEMGANHVGEIAELCEISDPDFGIITNIGKAHLEGFGSYENIKKGKSELYRHIQTKNGKLFVNVDDKLLVELSNNIEIIGYGVSTKAGYTGELLSGNPLRLSINKKHISTNLIGDYNFYNALAAACIGNYFGVSQSKIINGLESYQPDNNRSQLIKKGTNAIVMDAYNANPVSMQLALENFKNIKATKKIVVLGDMFELGKYSGEEHQKIVDKLTQLKFTKCILVGNEFQKTTRPKNYLGFNTSEDAANYFKQNPPINTTFLLKGSRGIKLEKVLETI